MKSNSVELSASLEDYLKAIFLLSKGSEPVRAKDISDQLHVSKPSVTGALKVLAEKELVNYAPYEAITLSVEGEKTAKEVLERYEALRGFLEEVLSIPENDAKDTACHLEHMIPVTIMKRLVGFIEYMQRCPRADVVWLDKDEKFLCIKKDADDCKGCVSHCSLNEI